MWGVICYLACVRIVWCGCNNNIWYFVVLLPVRLIIMFRFACARMYAYSNNGNDFIRVRVNTSAVISACRQKALRFVTAGTEQRTAKKDASRKWSLTRCAPCTVPPIRRSSIIFVLLIGGTWEKWGPWDGGEMRVGRLSVPVGNDIKLPSLTPPNSNEGEGAGLPQTPRSKTPTTPKLGGAAPRRPRRSQRPV